jgi:uncharacterized iron-regulated membrane protein
VAGKGSFRKLILNLHLWIGAAVLLLLTGGSGALLVFETEIDRVLNPTLTTVTPAPTTLSLTELKSALEHQYPGCGVLSFDISDSSDTSYGAFLQPQSGAGMNVAVDQHSGKALGVWDDNRFTRKLHGFHTHLLAEEIGSAVVGWGAVILLFLSITGRILWWRSKIFGIDFQTSGPKFQYDLHSTVGVTFFAVLRAFGPDRSRGSLGTTRSGGPARSVRCLPHGRRSRILLRNGRSPYSLRNSWQSRRRPFRALGPRSWIWPTARPAPCL